MIAGIGITLLVAGVVSWFWVVGIDDATQHKKQNPNNNQGDGWLDWDLKQTKDSI